MPPAAVPPIDETVDDRAGDRAGLRPHWRRLLDAFSALGEGGLAGRAARLDRAFAEERLAGLLPGAAAPAWRCDPVPLLLPAGEFAALEAGLAQRATLLEAVLDDLHGRRSLLESGALPPALVYANPGYLRCGRAAGRMLHVYAADLLRAPDGAWRVLADRTGLAAGIGYAQENRRLLARVLPEAFATLRLRPLAPFFERWQDALSGLAPAGTEPGRSPAVALLTPGTGSPHWVEHMRLSRELGCALVEGGDLTVRGGGLFLKTLHGLQPVDVLLRRTAGGTIDPLELDADSTIGVPGLLDAMRAGRVHIANHPGTGMAEAPALGAFLPALCRRLLGEAPLLDGVSTLWLGDPGALAVLRRDPARWRLLPALEGGARAGGAAPDAEALARVAARPWQWAAREAVAPSRAPSLSGSGLVPRPVVLRLFLVHDGAGWRAMPGGLARLADGGRTGKDVWVLAEDAADAIGPAVRPAAALGLNRSTGDLPSRVADTLFWLGRSVERLDSAARLIRAAVARLARAGAMPPREAAGLGVIARCLAEAEVIGEEAVAGPALRRALFAAASRGGMADQLMGRIAGLTESVRDRLTGDMYAIFSQSLGAARRDGADPPDLDALGQAMAGIRQFCTTVAGVAAENMVRGGGWLFLELGRRIERAQAIVAEIGAALDQPARRIEGGLLLALELCDSAITYRGRYLNVLQPAPVLDLVLADPGNPRGLAFQLVAMHTLLEELGGDDGRELRAVAAGLLAEVEMLVSRVLAAADQAEAATALPAGLRAVGRLLAELSERIARRYFALLPAARAVGLPGLRGAA